MHKYLKGKHGQVNGSHGSHELYLSGDFIPKTGFWGSIFSKVLPRCEGPRAPREHWAFPFTSTWSFPRRHRTAVLAEISDSALWGGVGMQVALFGSLVHAHTVEVTLRTGLLPSSPLVIFLIRKPFVSSCILPAEVLLGECVAMALHPMRWPHHLCPCSTGMRPSTGSRRAADPRPGL